MDYVALVYAVATNGRVAAVLVISSLLTVAYWIEHVARVESYLFARPVAHRSCSFDDCFHDLVTGSYLVRLQLGADWPSAKLTLGRHHQTATALALAEECPRRSL